MGDSKRVYTNPVKFINKLQKICMSPDGREFKILWKN